LAAAGLAAGVVTREEVAQVEAAAELREEAVRVDAFDAKEFTALRRTLDAGGLPRVPTHLDVDSEEAG
jgi:hypothetical protein